MTVTLDDVSCLLHLPIEGHLLDHHSIIIKDEGSLLIMSLLGDEPADGVSYHGQLLAAFRLKGL
jgi:hypothetical protein